jgi:multidrug efflux pump subunit AcrA (membrane-fusion protein)
MSCGCRQQHAEHIEHAAHSEATEESEPGIKYKADKGLLVPAATAKFIGLKIEDVSERKLSTTFSFDAAIYQAAAHAQFASVEPATPTTSLASALLNRRDAQPLRVGQEVNVQTAKHGNFRAHIRSIDATLGTNSSQVEVIVAIADGDQRLPHAASVSVIATNNSETAGAAIPSSALLRNAEGTFVYTVSGERFVRTPVKLGRVNHDLVEIADGLYAGDQVVVHPVMTLWMAELQSIRGGQACADGH